jgi:hypothetical protein
MTLGELKVLEAAHEAHPSCVLARPQLASDLGEAAALQEPSDHDPPLSIRHGLKAGLKGSGDRAAVAVVVRGRIRNEGYLQPVGISRNACKGLFSSYSWNPATGTPPGSPRRI